MYKLINISKAFAEKQVLSSINFSLNDEVVTLIGENGAGKTTLLRTMLGEIEPDDGHITQHRVRIGYVPQDPNLGNTIQGSFDASTERWRIDMALEDVGLADKLLDFETSLLSGGQKTRLAIARVLAQDPTPNVLLLDEPTNNLDADGLHWLEGFIKAFKGSMVFVSHDRRFINKTCTKVLELSGGKVREFSGNYDSYRAVKDLEHEQAVLAYETNAEERKRLQKTLTQKQADSEHTHSNIKRSDNDKYQRDYFRNRVTRGLGQQVRSMKTRLDQLEEISRPDSHKVYKLGLDGGVPNFKLIVRLEGVSKGFDRVLFEHINLELRGSDKIQIVGPNGSGKSTLLRVVAGLITPDIGTLTIGSDISIGYLSQEIDGLDYSKSPLDNLEPTGAKRKDIYREARALGLDKNDLGKLTSRLSRGQQSKLSFAILLLSKHDLLVLDEPTNHLDIPTREAIEQALVRYKGAILVASHDQYFIDSIGVTTKLELTKKEN